MSLNNRSIAILIAPRGTEEPEFVKPKEALENAGAKVTVISMESGSAETNNNDLDPGGSYSVDKSFGEVSADEFDGLVIPGYAAANKLSHSCGLSSKPVSRSARSAMRLGCWSRLTSWRDAPLLRFPPCGPTSKMPAAVGWIKRLS